MDNRSHCGNGDFKFDKGGILLMVSEAQKRANEKWKAANKEKQKIYRYRSQAKKFINEFADKEDLKTLEELIRLRYEKIRGEGNV